MLFIVLSDWIRAAQGFSILALFVMIGAVAVLIVCALKGEDDDPRMLMIGIALTGVAGMRKLYNISNYCTYAN